MRGERVNDREKGRRLLIINLTLMGDLLQMTPFLNGLRQENPEVHITLMVLKEFTDVCAGFPFVDEIESFDANDFISGMEGTDRSLVDNFRILERLVTRLRERHFDQIINLSFSDISAFLAYLLRVKDVRGVTMDEEGHRLLKHSWIRHFYNIVSNREINLFNYVDFIRKIGGCSRSAPMFFAVSESGRRFTRTFCEDRGISERDLVIGMQLGASRKNRWWPIPSFARLAEALIRDGGKIIFFGSSGERELGEKLSETVSLSVGEKASCLFDMTGQTTVDQLAALVDRCNILVTCDTGTMHVATAIGTQVVALFFGPAYFPETGPYGEGQIVMQADVPCAPCGHDTICKNPLCRQSISASHVKRVIDMIGEGSLASRCQLEDGPQWKEVQIYRAAFDEDGMLEFTPVIRRSLARMDVIRQVYREMWKLVLDERGGEIDPTRVKEKIQRCFAADGDPCFLQADRAGFDRLQALAFQGIEASRRLIRWSETPDQHVGAIKAEAQTMRVIDEQIEMQGMTRQACQTLTFMFRQGKENLEGNHIGLLAQDTLGLYEMLLREARLMSRGLERVSATMKVTP